MREIVKKEVIELLKLGDKVKHRDLLKLKEKYKDDELIETIISAFRKKYTTIRKTARTFADKIVERYKNYPYHVILQKARKYADKFDMSEFEFEEFKRILEKDLAGTDNPNEDLKPMSSVMKALGNPSYDIKELKLKSGDAKNLEEILNLYEKTKEHHSSALLQSILYQKEPSIDINVVTNNFERGVDDVNTHMAPILVAMFLQKNSELDSRFIFSNLSQIIYSRYHSKELETRSNYEFFYDLVNDPQDIVCNNKSTMSDLLYRCNLQTQLWNCVLHLRSGKIFNPSFNKFMTAVDVCTLNKYVNPDFIYGKYDGTVLQRLLNAFSYKPTVIAASELVDNVDIYNPYKYNIKPHVSRVPIISIRINNYDTHSIDTILKNSQEQFFIVNGQVVKKKVEIIYSRGNIFIQIVRQPKHINLDYYKGDYYKYPAGVEQFEKMEVSKATFDSIDSIVLGKGKGNEYQVSGIIANNTYEHGGMNYVTSNVAYVRDRDNRFYKYNPLEGKRNSFTPLNIFPDYYVNGIEDSENEKVFLENNSVIYILSSKEMDDNLKVKYI